MSVFDDLIAKLSEKNLSDMKVDEILKAGEAYASVIGENEEILEGMSRLKLSVLDKKRNKDIKNIDNYEDLNAMFDDYVVKKENDPKVINHSREADMAYKMKELVSAGKMTQDEVLNFSEKLMTTGCATYGSEEDKSLFRDSIVASYEICGYQSEQQRKMGDNVNKLDAELSGRPYIPEPHVDLYSRPTANEPDHNNIADSFKENATSYEAGRGVFSRFKEMVKSAWNSPELKKDREKIKDRFKRNNVFTVTKKTISDKPNLSMIAGAVSMFAGVGTANPALAAAGASILTAAAIKLYNEKIKGKVVKKSANVEKMNAKDKEIIGFSGRAVNGAALAIHSVKGGRNE